MSELLNKVDKIVKRNEAKNDATEIAETKELKQHKEREKISAKRVQEFIDFMISNNIPLRSFYYDNTPDNVAYYSDILHEYIGDGWNVEDYAIFENGTVLETHKDKYCKSNDPNNLCLRYTSFVNLKELFSNDHGLFLLANTVAKAIESDISDRVEEYNEYVDEIKELAPKAIKNLMRNRPKRYDSIVMGEETLSSWPLIDNRPENEDELEATQSINILEDGELIVVYINNSTGQKTATPLELIHISKNNIAAKSSYRGGCGYCESNSKNSKPLGYETLEDIYDAIKKESKRKYTGLLSLLNTLE